MLLISPLKAQAELAKRAKERRLGLGYTQKGLAERAGVSFPTLRKFEQTGKISLGSFLMIMDVLDGLEGILKAMKPDNASSFKRITDVIASTNAKPRLRGSKS